MKYSIRRKLIKKDLIIICFVLCLVGLPFTIFQLNNDNPNTDIQNKISPSSSQTGICRPNENLQNQWAVSDVNKINDSIEKPTAGDNTYNSHTGYYESKIDIFGMTTIEENEGNIEVLSITIHLYCKCQITTFGYAKIECSFSFGNEVWSSKKSVQSPYEWGWESFTWSGLRASKFALDNLQVKLRALIDATGFGGWVAVDAMYAEIEYRITLPHPPGVLGTDPLGEDIEYDLNYHIYSITGLSATTRYGLVTETGQPHELFLYGPTQYVYMGISTPPGPYVKSEDLQYQIIEMYRPFIVLRSEPWYTHKIELAEEETTETTISYTISLGLRSGYSYAEFALGSSTTTATGTFSGWDYSVSDGKTMVIYFWCTFLRVYGSVTYTDYEIYHEYDVFALQSIDFSNPYNVTYNSDVAPEDMELPEELDEIFRDENTNNAADPYYSLPVEPSSLYFGWTESKSYTTSWSISGRLFMQIGGDWWKGIYIGGSIKSATTTTQSTTVKHTYSQKQGIPDPRGTYYERFHFKYENAFSMNIHPDWPPTVTIISPKNGYTYSGNIIITASASDNEWISKVRCRFGSTWLADDLESPYQWSVNTANYPNGWTEIKCVAYDRCGNTAETTISINILNGGGGGGGGCPILFVYDGSEYIEEGLLDIHNIDGIDIIRVHELTVEPVINHRRYLLRLTEHPLTFSHIDQVKLYGRLSDGRLIPLMLTSATHSSLGQVRQELWFSDDKKIILLGADHNNGLSEVIDLEFYALKRANFNMFLFVIEGNNYIIKW